MASALDNTPMTCELSHDTIVVNGDLRISFRRTIRVPDNDQISFLPPDLGAYPLESVRKHIDKLPAELAAKGGVFFPMYQSEAVWIKFGHAGHQDYMIKMYVSGVNAISGEPTVEDAGTRLRHQVRLGSQNGLPRKMLLRCSRTISLSLVRNGLTVLRMLAARFGSL